MGSCLVDGVHYRDRHHIGKPYFAKIAKITSICVFFTQSLIYSTLPKTSQQETHKVIHNKRYWRIKKAANRSLFFSIIG